MKIIDAHTHPFLNELERTGAYGEFITDMDYFADDMARSGIEHFCGSVIRHIDGTEWAPVQEMNRHALAIWEKFPDTYTPGFHIHPNFPKESCEEIEYMASRGVKLIGELVPYFMRWRSYADPRLEEVFHLAEEKGMTVNVHPTDDEDLEAFMNKYPKLSIIVAHPRDGKDYMENLARLERHPNVNLDLSGTGMFRYGMLRHGVKKLGSERFLFGTDYPICNPGMYVEAVLFEKITDEEMENIFQKNAERLILHKEL
ncbi:MAG: amidohydrolase [Firmicutes bacterium]|nr:amidohydrolase [Bacillota bacterium]